MSNRNIDPAVENHKSISCKIEKMILNSIRKILPDKAVEDGRCLQCGRISQMLLLGKQHLHIRVGKVWQ